MARNSRTIFQPFHGNRTPGSGTAGDSFAGKAPDWQTAVTVVEQTPLTITTLIFTEGVDFPFNPHRWVNFEDAYSKRWWAYQLLKAFVAAGISTSGLGSGLGLILTAPGNPQPYIDYYPYPYAAILRRRKYMEWSASQLSLDAYSPTPPIIPANSYDVPVCEFLDEIQSHLLEVPDLGLSMSSGLWTVTEVLNYTNLRTYRFLLETGILQVRAAIPAPAAIAEIDLPTDLIDIKRVAWTRGTSTSELPRQDLLQTDAWIPDWQTNAAADPSVYGQSPEISLQVQLAPVPANAGTVDLTYVARTPAVINDCSIFPIPNEWVSFIKYGVLADMWAKEGEANDPERAAYSEQRYGEGIALARLLLGVITT